MSEKAITIREKLIELLESAESAIYWNSEDKNFIEKIADHLIANGVSFAKDMNVPSWIPVTEQLPHFSPNKWRKVIVTMEDDSGKRFTTTAIYNEKEKGWYAFADRRYEKFNVIAWMMKPEVYNDR